MSYGVSVKFRPSKDNPPWMAADDVVRINDTFEELPESNFIYEIHKEASARLSVKLACSKCKTKNDSDSKHCKNCGGQLEPSSTSNRIDLVKLWWSGNHASDSLSSVAPFVHGKLEAIFVGEDGEVFGGAIIEDGKYTKCSVEVTLIPED